MSAARVSYAVRRRRTHQGRRFPSRKSLEEFDFDHAHGLKAQAGCCAATWQPAIWRFGWPVPPVVDERPIPSNGNLFFQ